VVRLIVTLVTAPRLAPSGPKFSRAEIVDLVRESLPFTFLMVVASLYWRLDGLLLSVLSTVEQTGAYGIALQITAAFGFVSTIFCRATYSTIAEGFAKDRNRFRQAVSSSYRFMVVAAAPLAFFGFIMAEQLIELFSTPEFVAAATLVTQMFFIAAGLQYLNAMTTQPLFAAGQQRFLVRLSLINLLLNVAVNLALVPKYGAVGTGIAMIVSELVGVIAAAVRLYQIGAPVTSPFFVLRVLPALGLGALAFWLLSGLWFVAAALVTGVVYAAAVFLTGALSVDLVKQLLRRDRQDTDVVVQ
jgi:O-antigen/teichoic acid export membrane protein